jgi:dihydroxyacetone kinase
MRAAIEDAADELGRIDAVAGDGDHGRGMVKGVTAAAAAAAQSEAWGAGAATVLAAAGDAWGSKAGGTSGVLWGAALTAVGQRLGDAPETLTATDVVDAVEAGLTALQTLGKAKVGDKTMIDALVPFVNELRRGVVAGQRLPLAWSSAARVSQRAADDTAQLRPRIGRARPLAERSIGTPDAGAISLAMCLQTIADTLNADPAPTHTQDRKCRT